MRAMWKLGLLAICAGGLLMVSQGCRGNSTSTSSATSQAAAPDGSALQIEVEDQLKSALYQLQPENLGIDSRLDDAVSVLNNWWAAVEAAKLEPTGLTPPDIPAGRLPEPLLPRLQKAAYDPFDGRHIRAAYLAEGIADRIASETEQELERVTRSFDWVCRNIALVPEDEPLPPLTFYETLLLGRGRAADRIVVFATILKQLKLDTLVLRAAEAEQPDAPSLVGVPLEGEVYLFDPQLGLPIPRGDEPVAAVISRPATLKQIREHPDWLKTLSARSDQPYEPTAEQMAAPKVDVVTFPTAWTARMWKLEQLLPGDSVCVLYEAPDALGDAPGPFARVAALDAAWSADKIGVWTYPLQREVQFAQMDQNTARLMQVTLASFSVPLEVARDEKAGVPRQTPTMRHLKTRTVQLQGRSAEALSQYVSIRLLAVTPAPDPAWNPIYQIAAEDAFFWSCLCKYESGEYESAVTLLGDYLKRHRRGGRWLGAAGVLLAQCHCELGQLPAGLQALKTAATDDAYRATAAVLTKRWAEAAAAKP
jgi:hypothetical protein